MLFSGPCSAKQIQTCFQRMMNVRIQVSLDLALFGISKKNGFRAEIIFDFTLLPQGFRERRAACQRLVNAIKEGKSNQIRLGFLQTEEVVACSIGQIGGEVVNERTREHSGGGVAEGVSEGLQDRQVGGAFEVKHPAL